ncbi:MAG: FAD-dependent oxidoreductase, partial [bacterium]|nr:FAD-dependent oxidoreductase [bacterium]
MKRGILIFALMIIGMSAWAQPTAVEAIAQSPAQINVYWLPPIQGEVQSYVVMRDGQPIATLPAEARQFTDEPLTPAQTYRYRVVARMKDGVQQPSPEVMERTFRELPKRIHYPLVVVGGTASGVGAAVTAAREGVTVALLEHTNRLGGMISNGVSFTDMRNPARSNGLFEEFRRAVQQHYGTGNGMAYEPRVANMLIKNMVAQHPNIHVYFRVRPVKVLREDNGRIRAVVVQELLTGRRATFEGDIFIDATYEGDIAAWGGAPFRIGREPRSPEEPHAGHIYYDRANDRILPGSTGKGDKRIPSYAILLTVKDYGAGADRTIPKPPFYDKNNYIHTPPWEKTWAYLYGRMPGGKFEINQHPQGSNLPGINYDYPTASWKRRDEIAERYKWHALGYLYYIQTELGLKNIGLADDEYRDNGNVPPQLYVREARRIMGHVLMNQSDVWKARERLRPDSIAIGDYPMDSHAVQPKTDWSSPDMGEGEFWLVKYTPWYQVPFGILLPLRLRNLLVSTAVSATHVAYGTLRMEPVRVNMGQAAGAAAALALRYDTEPKRIPSRLVQEVLLRYGVYLYWFPDVTAETRGFRAIQYLAARGYFPEERFEPDKMLNRADAARWLWHRLRQDGFEVAHTTPTLPYTDLPAEHPARQAVEGLVAAGVLQPEGTQFYPDAPISRGLFAQWLVGVMAKLNRWTPVSPEKPRYLDVPVDSPFASAVETLYKHRITSVLWDGVDAFQEHGVRFFADGPITRADAARTLYL